MPTQDDEQFESYLKQFRPVAPEALPPIASAHKPRSLWKLSVLIAAAVIMAVGCGLYFRARIGGYTGDCLGATQQLAELAFLVVALAVLRPAAQLP